MFIANNNYSLLPETYLFSEVARRLREFSEAHPESDIIRMDIGDVSLPLPSVVVNAMSEAIGEMGSQAGFHGYGPEQGYKFLRDAIAKYDYADRGIKTIDADDIFISDGAKSDLANLGDLFGENVRVGVPDPVYPVYVDSNVLSGRGGNLINEEWSGITYFSGSAINGFLPEIPENDVDIIYLCFPNNPTGIGISHEALKKWVDYAINNNSLIIFDSAYEAYVRTPDSVRSIYEIEGAEKVAIEIRSFSKTAGFTGVRCGYTIVPKSLDFTFSDSSHANLNKMWNRRQSTKFNGVGYIVQKGAESLYTPEGREAIRKNTDYYMRNAGLLREALIERGYEVFGGIDSPYVWFRPSDTLSSWDSFDLLLNGAAISSTPGSGFGKAGEGYLRFTGFNTYEKTLEAIKRLKGIDLK